MTAGTAFPASYKRAWENIHLCSWARLMSYPNAARSAALNRAGLAIWSVVFVPGLLCAQQAVSAGMASFPADTQQVDYSNFAQLRSSPDYPQIRQYVLYRQFHGFQEFLRSLGIDPEKDVDEVLLGWRGESLGGPGSYGVAAGRFEPDKVRALVMQNRLPVQSHVGYDLFAYGSGADPADIFFTILDSSLAAFGRLHDLKALLDVKEGSADPLESNQAFRGYEAELEQTSAQWGVLTGKAAANVAAPWLAGGKKTTIDVTVFTDSIQAVLYRVDWDGTFTVHISVVCKTPETAAGLFKLLNILKSLPVSSDAGGRPASASLLQNLDARQDGSRLELSASGPAEALDQILRVE